jgi:Leucine-rich repeat (LRR) protein
MTRQEIKEELCYYDLRNPDAVGIYVKNFKSNVHVLFLDNNYISNIKELYFDGENLFLDHNKIKLLEGYTYNNKTLDLSNNNIKSLDGFKFEGFNLIIYDNSITSLDSFVYHSNTVLIRCDLHLIDKHYDEMLSSNIIFVSNEME